MVHEVDALELLEVQLANATARSSSSADFDHRWRRHLHGANYVVNVSAMEASSVAATRDQVTPTPTWRRLRSTC